MENKRYDFGGFAFGSDGQVELSIRTLKSSGMGYTMEVSFELSSTERLELLRKLITLGEKDND